MSAITTSMPRDSRRRDRVEDHRARVAARARRARSRRRRARPTPRAARSRRRDRCRPPRRSPTGRARCFRCQASLPIVVVLPVPLTPTTMITAGPRRRSMRRSSRRRDLGEQLHQALAHRLGAADGARLAPRARACPTTSAVVCAPTSARISASSRRSQVSSSSWSNRLALSSAWSACRLFERLSRRRRKQRRPRPLLRVRGAPASAAGCRAAPVTEIEGFAPAARPWRAQVNRGGC